MFVETWVDHIERTADNLARLHERVNTILKAEDFDLMLRRQSIISLPGLEDMGRQRW